MKVILKQLSLENFKGSRKNTLYFSDETNIYGANGTGKTTISDAFMWLLFGKDSSDRKDFAIKPLDYLGVPSEKLEIVVEGVLLIDDFTTTIKRIFREKWVKKRGEEVPEFAGNETIFSWNEVPLTQKEFQDRVANILPENLFKIVTNPLYFNSLKWQEKRQILIGMVGSVTDKDLVNAKNKYMDLVDVLQQGKTLDEYKKELTSKAKKLREEIKLIPSRIDEASKSIKDIEKSDVVKAKIEVKTKHLHEIEAQLNSIVKAQKAQQEEILALQRNVFDKKKALDLLVADTEKELRKGVDEKQQKVQKIKHEILSHNGSIEYLSKSIKERNKIIETKNAKLVSLREEFKRIDSTQLVFDEDSFVCPTCKRVHDAEDIVAQKEQMLKNFNEDKTNKKEGIRREGKKLGAEIEQETQKNVDDNNKIEKLQKTISSLEVELGEIRLNELSSKENVFELEETLAKNPAYKELKAEIEKLISDIDNRPTQENMDLELKASKESIVKELDELKALLVQNNLNSLQQKRVKELEAEMAKLSSELSNHERLEFLLQEFTKDKISMLESKVNEKFDFVNFKMFDVQINGGEVETCEILVNGVPFSDANTAGKLVAGIDIINTLSEHYGIFAPIFCDNRESVTVIQPTRSQVINLFVSPNDKFLRVE